jgi:hypothetical protein
MVIDTTANILIVATLKNRAIALFPKVVDAIFVPVVSKFLAGIGSCGTG